MPLADLQSALGTMVSAHAAAGYLSAAMEESLNRLNLTQGEWDWLESLPAMSGFKITCDIQRWWRETRLRGVARLTLTALGPEEATRLLNEFLSAHLCVSLFFLPEALLFLSFVARAVEHPHLTAIASFERALLIANEAALQPAQTNVTQSTEIIDFASPPEELLAALLLNRKLPEPSEKRFSVLVAPFLPHLWRPVTQGDTTRQEAVGSRQ